MSTDWVIKVGASYWRPSMSGMFGTTDDITKAERYETENLVREVCTSLHSKHPCIRFEPMRLPV